MKPVLLCLLALLACLPQPTAAQPNLLVILTDDMGYGDLEITGTQYLKTPNLTRLAEEGIFCSQAYVPSSVCSPSRAGIMTGRDPRRFGYQANLNKGSASYQTRPELLGLAPGEHTLADHLGAAEYETALIGKWHLGTGEGFHPLDRGFDYFCGMLGGSHGYFPTPERNSLERNREEIPEFSSPYLTDFFTDEGLRWIEKQEAEDRPWFAFLSYNAPHTPMQATEEDLAVFSQIENPKRRTYAAMMYNLDRNVGRILDALEEKEIREETLIVFFSDNGGATSNSAWNGPLSGAKGTLREGGIRIPMIWSWPGALPEDSELKAPVSALDVLPTFLAAANAEPLPLAPALPHEDKRNQERSVKTYGAYDGTNLLLALSGQEKEIEALRNRVLHWRLQGQTAILSGDRKLIRLAHRPAQLFAPGSDLGEGSDLAASEPEKLAELFQQMAQWEAFLPTVPLWGSSPFWRGESAKHYDKIAPGPEPK
ncbi:MAG: sulfatase-like hydrolase/transferase [Verrucomicrobiales bacterium]|nr:sulfatase-like hydrolase/transferase [Verrucomicrobiales bacterium]